MFRYAWFALLVISGCGGKVDDETSGAGRSSATGAAGDDAGMGASAPPPSGTGTEPGPPSTSGCAPVSPMKADFEVGGLDPAWSVTGPSAFAIEPLGGQKGLRVELASAPAFITIPVFAPACRVTLSFKVFVSPQIIANDHVTMVRVSAGPKAWFYLLLNKGELSLAAELRTAQAASMGHLGPLGKLTPGILSHVALAVDFGKKQVGAALVADGLPMPALTMKAMRVDESDPHSNPGPINAIDLGSAPGFAASPSGKYWIDDLTIE